SVHNLIWVFRGESKLVTRSARAVGRGVGLAITALVLLAGAAPVANAQGAAELSAIAGFDNRYTPSGWLPLSVTVEASHALQGHLEISSASSSGRPSTHVQPVEVPGGGQKRFDLLVAAPLPRSGLEITLVEGGDAVAEVTLEPIAVENEVMVGVLGDEAPSALDGLLVQPTLAEVHPVALEPELIELGPRALDILDYVVVDGSALDELSEPYLAALTEWALVGGRLIVAGPTSRVQPEEPRPVMGGAAGIGALGFGEIVAIRAPLVEVAAQRRLWETIIRPAPVSGGGGNSFRDNFGFLPDGSVVSALHGGQHSVGLGWFVIFLLGYLALVGPINYVVLKRRGRRELMWITIPVLALAFSAVAYGLARGTRGGTELRAAGMTFSSSDSSTGRMIATLTSGAGGTRSIGFEGPPASAASLEEFGVSFPRASTTSTPDGPEVGFETSPFSIAAASGPLTATGGIEARLAPEGDGWAGEIVNNSGRPLVDISLMMGGGATEVVDSLGPGESARVTYDSSAWRVRRSHGWGLVQGRLKSSLFGQLNGLVGVVSALHHPVAFGYAEEIPLPVRIDGSAETVRGKLLMASPVQVDVPNGAAVVPRGAGGIDLVAFDGGDIFMNGPRRLGLEGFGNAVFVHRLPSGLAASDVAGGTLDIATSGPGSELEVFDWAAAEWTNLGRARGAHALGPQQVSPAGETYFRLEPLRHSFVQVGNLSVEVKLR
ncbi:MAG: hypothetical protein ACRDKZ_05040, partial [Actinomycetota bacterium]